MIIILGKLELDRPVTNLIFENSQNFSSSKNWSFWGCRDYSETTKIECRWRIGRV